MQMTIAIRRSLASLGNLQKLIKFGYLVGTVINMAKQPGHVSEHFIDPLKRNRCDRFQWNRVRTRASFAFALSER